MSMYEFDPSDARRFADHIGIQARQRGDELIFSKCPYCRNSTNSKEKFAINLRTGQFNCFRASCGVRGNMFTLSKDFNFQISEQVDRYLNRNSYNSRFKKFRESHKESTDPAIKYLRNRGISEDVCRKYELTTKAEQDNVLVFPFKDQNGELRFIKYRNMDFIKGETKGSKEWCEADCMPILFGMNHCTDGRLIITEGQIDSLSCAEAGLDNAVSVPTGAQGTTWIPHCFDWISKRFDEIVVFGDCENGKITLTEMIQSRFGKSKRIRIVRMEDYQDCKDANELLQKHGKDAVRQAVENAETVLSLQVKDMSDVQVVDMSKIPRISTGFKKADEKLGGGFMFGQVILLTGKRGNGKSTLGSQFVCEALRQGYNGFIYSGELPNFYVKSWIDGQIYGHSHLTNAQINECEDMYRDRLFIYNSSLIETDELDDLLTVVEDTIIKKDIKFVLLDNLMTALSAETNEQLYRRQSEFVGRLAKMAKAYNNVIMLVAHPRKSKAQFDNDDVSGTADITNRVDVVMSYDKDDKLSDDVRKLKITKNRLTGRLGEIELYFDEDSKRISDTPADFEKDYLASKFRPSDDLPDEIPF